jgi:hypothetical protein
VQAFHPSQRALSWKKRWKSGAFWQPPPAAYPPLVGDIVIQISHRQRIVKVAQSMFSLRQSRLVVWYIWPKMLPSWPYTRYISWYVAAPAGRAAHHQLATFSLVCR